MAHLVQSDPMPHISYLQAILANPSLPQVAFFTLLITIVWSAEFRIFRPDSGTKWLHGGKNLAFIAGVLPVQLFTVQLALTLAAWAGQHRFGLLFLLPHADSPWIKYGLMFVVLDFLDYVYHRAMHHFPLLWRFHRTHHSDEALDVSSTMRENPGETFVRNMFLAAWVLLTGASVEMLVIRQTVESISNISSHTTLRLPDRLGSLIGWVFITPNLHHVHHHHRLPATDSNFGDVFSLWDRLCGTLIELRRDQIVFGLEPVAAVEAPAVAFAAAGE